MSTKTEEKLRKILKEETKEQVDLINDSVGGVFLYGVIVGIIISYTGFLGYFAGVGSGMLISSKYKYISEQVSMRIIRWYDIVLKKIMKETDK